MLTSHAIEELFSRLRQQVSKGVKDVFESFQNEQLAFSPWEGFESAVRSATLHAVSFANHHGGELILGISNTGHITGCPITDASRLPHEIFTRTRPGIIVDIRIHPAAEGPLIVISVPEGMTLHSTSDGVIVRRSGRNNVPVLLENDADNAGERLDSDFTDGCMQGSRMSDIDPMQMIYLREILRRKNDQSELLELSNDELLHALGLVSENGVPKIAALLLLGSRKILKERLPQTEVVYLHLDEREELDVHEQLTLPLLHTLSRLQDLIEARNRFTVLRQGLFHFQVKDFDEEVYREALVNALVHRDYSRRDASVHISHQAERLEISNPGGLIGGISVDNILYHPPRHRNRRLTEVLQHLGLMERAGAGVNRLYRHLLRKGKEPPVYEVSPDSVRLTIQGGNIDESFAAFVYEEEARGRLFGLDMLIVLSSLKRLKMIERSLAAKLCQRPDRVISNTLNKMVELGYLERVGVKRGLAFRLSGWVYERLGSKVGYYRDRGLSQKRQKALILEVVMEMKGVTIEQCQELCGVDETEALKLMEALINQNLLKLEKDRYVLSLNDHNKTFSSDSDNGLDKYNSVIDINYQTNYQTMDSRNESIVEDIMPYDDD